MVRCPGACSPIGCSTARRRFHQVLRGEEVECEFALRLTGNCRAGSGPVKPAELADTLTFHPAIELAGSRYAPGTGNRAATTSTASR